jgi:putative DNA primase/helicase
MSTHYDQEIDTAAIRHASTSKGTRGNCPICQGHMTCVLYANGPHCFKCQESRALRNHFKGQNFAPPALQDDSRKAINQRLAKLDKTWMKSLPVASGDLVDEYLRFRGFKFEVFPRDLAFHPALDYWHKFSEQPKDELPKFIGTFPAMLALIRDVNGKPVNVHRTYLASNGHSKAPLPTEPEKLAAKKIMTYTYAGANEGCAIRLMDPEPILIISEGIENALSAHLLTGKPAWASGSSGSLIKWIPPKMVQEVWIAGDHDEAGIKAAKRLSIRLQDDGLKVKIALPPTVGNDWNDYFLKNGN